MASAKFDDVEHDHNYFVKNLLTSPCLSNDEKRLLLALDNSRSKLTHKMHLNDERKTKYKVPKRRRLFKLSPIQAIQVVEKKTVSGKTKVIYEPINGIEVETYEYDDFIGSLARKQVKSTRARSAYKMGEVVIVDHDHNYFVKNLPKVPLTSEEIQTKSTEEQSPVDSKIAVINIGEQETFQVEVVDTGKIETSPRFLSIIPREENPEREDPLTLLEKQLAKECQEEEKRLRLLVGFTESFQLAKKETPYERRRRLFMEGISAI